MHNSSVGFPIGHFNSLLAARVVMADSFDPYYQWLGIEPPDQPPNYYRLLAIEPFLDNREIIAGAADRQMAHLRTFQRGPQAATSQRMLNEVSIAKVCLLNPQKKTVYDEQLRKKLARGASGSSRLIEIDWIAPCRWGSSP